MLVLFTLDSDLGRMKMAGPPNPPKGITGSPNEPHLSDNALQINLYLYGNCKLWNPKPKGDPKAINYN